LSDGRFGDGRAGGHLGQAAAPWRNLPLDGRRSDAKAGVCDRRV